MPIPRIYVACLASYNNGILHGEWIDLDGSEDLENRIQEILKKSPEPDAEEWAVHDSEYCSNLGEYPGIDALKDITQAYETCTSRCADWEVFLAYCEHRGEIPVEEHFRAFEDAYAGKGKTMEGWCHEFLSDTGQLQQIPESLRFYFNFSAYAQDLEINEVFTVEHQGDVFVFWRN